MSDYYYNENEGMGYNGYGIPSQPPQPPKPPQAPRMNVPPQAPPTRSEYPAGDYPTNQQQYYGASPAQPNPPQAPVLNTPPHIPQQQAPYSSPYQNSNPYPQPERTFRESPYEPNYESRYESPYTPSNPPKHPMGAGLKALVIIVIALLFVSLVAFISYLTISSDKNPNNNQNGFVPSPETTAPEESVPFGNFSFGDDDESATAPSTGSYEESDAKDKIDKDFKGIELKKKPSKVSSDKSGSSYAFSQVEKSVVGIIGYVDGQEGTAKSYTQMGTGIIATSDGYIITNGHLIKYSRTAYLYKVITDDKKEYKAGVVGYDSRSDLAVLKIDAKGLTPVSFGDSSEIEVTEDVIVVGNPLSLNYQNSVTKGIISAVDRQVSITNNVKCIQTDAAINPGNSGGPLCNMYGQVIGITNSKIALDDYEGMGFAIPSKLVKSIVEDIIRYSYVQGRVRIGILGEVSYLSSDSDETGIEIEVINEGGPMDGTDIKVGDIITKVDDTKISNFADIYDLLENHKAGDKVKVTVYRPSDEKEYEATITLEADEN